MSDAIDLKELFAAWLYDPDHCARLVRAPDGRELLHVRLPLGLEQYEMTGRPDGARPHGTESCLDYQLERLAQAKAAGREKSFKLQSDDCEELFREGTLYYLRYLHLFQIKDWLRTVRDTARNLRLFDFVHHHAARAEDRIYLEKWRPYILRLNGVAHAMMELDQGHHRAAQQIVHEVMQRIEALPELEEDTFRYERGRSLEALKELARHLEQSRPLSVRERLERDLKRAIELQDFERAALLRDRIRALKPSDSAPA